MFIKKLSIRNLRCFKEATLDFVYPGCSREDGFSEIPESTWPPELDNVNVILGINGAGKSTVLSAIALATMSVVLSKPSGFNPYSLIRQGRAGETIKSTALNAELVLHPQDLEGSDWPSWQPKQIGTWITRRGDYDEISVEGGDDEIWDKMFDDSSPAFMMVGYSATRCVDIRASASLASAQRRRHLRYQRVACLFEQSFSLIPLTLWLPEMEFRRPAHYKQVVSLIRKLLPKKTRFIAKLKDSEYLFGHRSTEVPFGALSDGLKAYIGWISDLLYHICIGCPPKTKLVDYRGIVMVDEIALHIHPEWQLELIPTLARVLPNLQFVLTTHSPIVAGTVQRANTYQLQTHASHSTLKRPEISSYGLTAEQILRSEAFGLSTTRTEKFAAELRRLEREAAGGNVEAAEDLMRKASQGPLAASSPSKKDMPAWVKRKMAKKSAD